MRGLVGGIEKKGVLAVLEGIELALIEGVIDWLVLFKDIFVGDVVRKAIRGGVVAWDPCSGVHLSLSFPQLLI